AFGGPLDFCWRDVDLWGPWSLRYLAACSPGRFKTGTEALRGLLERAVPAWQELLLSVGRPEMIAESGHYHLWESDASAHEGLARMKAADVRPARWRPITAEEQGRLADRFNGKVRGGIFFENTARLADPGGTVEALWAGLANSGGQTVKGRVRALHADGERT